MEPLLSVLSWDIAVNHGHSLVLMLEKRNTVSHDRESAEGRA